MSRHRGWGIRLRLYWEVARRAFRRYATYRGATLGGLFTNTVFGFMRGYVLLALLRARTVNGYDAQAGLTYVWLTQGMIMVIAFWSGGDIPERIRTGAITTDLSRPVDFQRYSLAQDLGRATFQVLARGVPPFVIGALLFSLRVPGSVAQGAAFAASLVLAMLVSFGARFIVDLTAFWLLDANGFALVYILTANFLSGFIVPIALFPGWLRGTANLLPFASMLQIPIDVFIGQLHGAATMRALAIQAAWAVVLFAGGHVVLGAATRKVVVQGG